MGFNKHFFFSFFLLLSTTIVLHAQLNSYILYLKDKNGTTGTLQNPAGFLSVKSIERRSTQHIRIDSTDLPVSQQYLTQIINAGAEIVFVSKWMNAVCIKATSAQYATIIAMPFVSNSISSFRTSDHANTQLNATSAQQNYASYYSDYIGITQMHEAGIKGKDVLIAITDSGFPGTDTLTAFKHLWHNDQVLYHYDVADNNTNVFDDDNHGTYILSILAADTLNYKGVVPDASYILLRTEVAATESKLEEYNWLRGAEIADSCGADIISVSLGYNTFDNAAVDYTYADMNGHTSIIARAADIAYEKGMIVVCAAGNDGNQPWKYIGTPADAYNVLAVGSVDMNNSRSAFSSVGPTSDGRIKPDLCAPGSNIYCITPSGAYLITGGTSLATPMITGLVAGMKESVPELSNNEIKQILLQSCDDYHNPDNEKGYGVPDFSKIIAFASIYTNTQTSIIAPNPYETGDLFVKVPFDNVQYHIEVFDYQGKLFEDVSQYASSKIIQINDLVNELKSGLYFIRVESSNSHEILKWIKL